MKIPLILTTVVNIFDTYFSFISDRTGNFYFRPLADGGSGVPKFACQPVGRNCFAKIIPDMCKSVGIGGRKTGHYGKVTSATTLYHQNFEDQLIKERMGHCSIKALHKYKRTASNQQHEVFMALLPPVAKKKNVPPQSVSLLPPVAKKENVPPQSVFLLPLVAKKGFMPPYDDVTIVMTSNH